MDDFTFHTATDRRCYYGCPSSDLKREWEDIDKAKKYLKENNLSVTYFPNGGFYVGFKRHNDKAPEIMTEDCSSFELCFIALLKKVNGENK